MQIYGLDYNGEPYHPTLIKQEILHTESLLTEILILLNNRLCLFFFPLGYLLIFCSLTLFDSFNYN